MIAASVLATAAYCVGSALLLFLLLVVVALFWRRLTAPKALPWPTRTDVRPVDWKAWVAGQLSHLSSAVDADGNPRQTGDLHVAWAAQARARSCALVGYELFPGMQVVICTEPVDLEHLIVGPAAPFVVKHKFYEGLEFLLGKESLVTLRDVNIHRRLHALVAPVFKWPSVKDIASYVMQKHLASFVANVNRQTASDSMPGGGGICNIAKECQLFSLHTICEAGFKQLAVNGVNVADTFLAANSGLRFEWTDLFPVWLRRNHYVFPTSRNVQSARTLHTLRQSCNAIISKGREEAALLAAGRESSGKERKTGAEISDMGGRKTILDFLVAEKELTESEILSTELTLLLAAFETTEKTICAALYFVATNPKSQERLLEELRDAVNLGVQPQLEDLLELPYLNAVFKEASRLHPAAPWVGRVLTRETMLPSGVVVPEGMHLQINIHGMHRHPLYNTKKNPDSVDQFVPERWLDDDELKQRLAAPGGRCLWMPFLPDGHSRQCIGKNLAVAEILLVVATLVRSYELMYPSDWPAPKRTWGLTMRLEPDVKLHMKRRNN